MNRVPAFGEHRDGTLDDLIAGRMPDESGRYATFGGRFVPETLVQRRTQAREEMRTRRLRQRISDLQEELGDG